MVTTLSSREFNQDTGAAKRAAANGPVIITDRGRPAHVLLTFEDYRKLSEELPQASIVELLGMPDSDEVELEPQRLSGPIARPADLT